MISLINSSLLSVYMLVSVQHTYEIQEHKVGGYSTCIIRDSGTQGQLMVVEGD